MDIKQARVGDVILITTGERLEATTAPPFEAAIDAALKEENCRVLVDLSGLTYISSAGIGTLVKGASLAKASGRQISLCGIRDGLVADVFQKTGIGALFDLHATSEEAFAHLGVAATIGQATPMSTTPVEPEAASSVIDDSQLTLLDELFLLTLDDEQGRAIDLPNHALDYALAGGALMELFVRKRIDTDLEHLRVVDATPMGDDLLDPILDAIHTAPHVEHARYWIRLLLHDAPVIRKRVVDHLVKRGILRREKNRLLWVLGGRRYPVRDDAQRQEVRQRVLDLIRSDAIPDPRDVIIIALAEACAVFDALLDLDEMDERRPRILDIARMDLLAQSLVEALVNTQWESREDEVMDITIFPHAADRSVTG
jgi:Golgi phosphoprotein 3